MRAEALHKLGIHGALAFGIADLAVLNLAIAPNVFVTEAVKPAIEAAPIRIEPIEIAPEPEPEPEAAPAKPRTWRLYFRTDDSDLHARHDAVLREVLAAAQLDSSPIEVIGSSDPRGTERHNRQLSVRRAQAAAAWLEARGVAVDRLIVRGEGELGAGSDEPLRRFRRVEIHLGRRE
jgi:outer membrane protein OmpA-like peptidoglycan-associated protein